jgi:hypothetical protein
MHKGRSHFNPEKRSQSPFNQRRSHITQKTDRISPRKTIAHTIQLKTIAPQKQRSQPPFIRNDRTSTKSIAQQEKRSHKFNSYVIDWTLGKRPNLSFTEFDRSSFRKRSPFPFIRDDRSTRATIVEETLKK